MSKKASIKDIANKVGVSAALVSYVLNGLEKEKRVGKETVDRIKEAARDMNYQPNQIARSLRKGSTNTIGLIVADIANPFFGQLARIIEDEASRHNYVVILGSSDEDCNKSESLIETFHNRQVDGFIIVPSEGDENQIKSLVRKEVPLVLIDRYFPEISSNFIMLDNRKATYSATQHLIDKGYKKIAMVAYKSGLVHMQERINGYRDAMKDQLLQDNILLEEFGFNQPDMETRMNNIIKNENLEAIVFATNKLTIAGLYAIKKNNIHIPENLAIIGFDENEAFDFFNPPLTFIQQPLEEMGKEAVRLVIEQIRGSEKIVHIELKHKLIHRLSC